MAILILSPQAARRSQAVSEEVFLHLACFLSVFRTPFSKSSSLPFCLEHVSQFRRTIVCAYDYHRVLGVSRDASKVVRVIVIIVRANCIVMALWILTAFV